MGDYLNVSVEITKMITDFVPKESVHVYSVDELWVTVDGLERLYGSVYEIAELLQQNIRDQFGMECVVGIGDNKFLAKVVMDIHAKKQPTELPNVGTKTSRDCYGQFPSKRFGASVRE